MDAGEIALFLGLSVTSVTTLDLLGKSPFVSKDAFYTDLGSSSPDHGLFWPESGHLDHHGLNVPDQDGCRWVI